MKTNKLLLKSLSILLLMVTLMLFNNKAKADRLVWISNGLGGSQSWNTASNWWDSTSNQVATNPPSSSDDVAIHDSTSIYFAIEGSNVTIKCPILDVSGTTINTITVYGIGAFYGQSGNSLTIADSVGLSGNGTNNGNIYVDGSTLFIGTTGSGDINGPGSFHMSYDNAHQFTGIVHVRGNFLPGNFERGSGATGSGIFSYVILDGSGSHIMGSYDFCFLEVDDNMTVTNTGTEVDSNLTGTGALICGTKNQTVTFLGDTMSITGFTCDSCLMNLWGSSSLGNEIQYFTHNYTFWDVDQENATTQLDANVVVDNRFDFDELGGGDYVILNSNNFTMKPSTSLYFDNGSGHTFTSKTVDSAAGYFVTNGIGALVMATSNNGIQFPIGTSNTSYTPITFTSPAATNPVLDVRVVTGVTDGSFVAVGSGVVNNEWLVKPENSTTESFGISTSWGRNGDELSLDEHQTVVSWRKSEAHPGPKDWTPIGVVGPTSLDGTNTAGRDTIIANGSLSMDNSGIDSFYIATGSNTTALPVSFLTFGAQYQDGHVNLNWTTASEQNNAYFEVERSADAASWTSIGQVQGHGTSNVLNSYVDVDNLVGVVPAGTLYYRLKQVDFNGKFAYSMIRSVDLNNPGPSLAMYPNPTSNTLNVNWTSATDDNTVLRLVNMSGVNVYSQTVSGKGMIQRQIDMSSLPSGVYYLQVISGNGNTVNEPVFKN